MDIEQTKRMNHMIKQLTSRGVVTEFDDAVSMASSLYDNAMPDSQEPVKVSAAEKKDEGQQSGMELVERKIHYAIKENNVLINGQMEKFYNEIQELKSCIAELKARKPIVQVEEKQPVQQVLEPVKPKAEKSSPRIGEFTPDNIVLENYFYYGK